MDEGLVLGFKEGYIAGKDRRCDEVCSITVPTA
jgi:hypothetical protein